MFVFTQMHIVGHKSVEQRLHYRMASVANIDDAVLHELRANVAALGSALRQRTKHVELGERLRRRQQIVDSECDAIHQLIEELLLEPQLARLRGGNRQLEI